MKVPFSMEKIENSCKLIVKENNLEECYIRPLAYYGYGKMGLNPIGVPVDVIIACWSWGSYLGKEMIRIKTSKYIRIHPKTIVADAKISGHYVNLIMSLLEVSADDNFDEGLFLDYEGNIAEGPGENLFIIKDGKIYTPKLGNILAGITRSSVIEFAKDLGYKIIEKTLTLDDLKNADEAFYTGTAAEITGIKQIDNTIIGGDIMGEIIKKFKNKFLDIIHGKDEKYDEWLTYTESKI